MNEKRVTLWDLIFYSMLFFVCGLNLGDDNHALKAIFGVPALIICVVAMGCRWRARANRG